jgi:ABC-type sugar transport system permease subunit
VVAGVETILGFITTHWKTILIIMGLAVAGVTAYTVASAVVQAQPAFVQAIQITAYAIPVLVYSLVIQFIFQMISTIRELFRR